MRSPFGSWRLGRAGRGDHHTTPPSFRLGEHAPHDGGGAAAAATRATLARALALDRLEREAALVEVGGGRPGEGEATVSTITMLPKASPKASSKKGAKTPMSKSAAAAAAAAIAVSSSSDNTLAVNGGGAMLSPELEAALTSLSPKMRNELEAMALSGERLDRARVLELLRDCEATGDEAGAAALMLALPRVIEANGGARLRLAASGLSASALVSGGNARGKRPIYSEEEEEALRKLARAIAAAAAEAERSRRITDEHAEFEAKSKPGADAEAGDRVGLACHLELVRSQHTQPTPLATTSNDAALNDARGRGFFGGGGTRAAPPPVERVPSRLWELLEETARLDRTLAHAEFALTALTSAAGGAAPSALKTTEDAVVIAAASAAEARSQVATSASALASASEERARRSASVFVPCPEEGVRLLLPFELLPLALQDELAAMDPPIEQIDANALARIVEARRAARAELAALRPVAVRRARTKLEALRARALEPVTCQLSVGGGELGIEWCDDSDVTNGEHQLVVKSVSADGQAAALGVYAYDALMGEGMLATTVGSSAAAASSHARDGSAWTQISLGVRPGWVLMTLNGERVRTPADVVRALEAADATWQAALVDDARIDASTEAAKAAAHRALASSRTSIAQTATARFAAAFTAPGGSTSSVAAAASSSSSSSYSSPPRPGSVDFGAAQFESGAHDGVLPPPFNEYAKSSGNENKHRRYDRDGSVTIEKGKGWKLAHGQGAPLGAGRIVAFACSLERADFRSLKNEGLGGDAVAQPVTDAYEENADYDESDDEYDDEDDVQSSKLGVTWGPHGRVIEVAPGSPAARRGIRLGVCLVSVDGARLDYARGPNELDEALRRAAIFGGARARRLTLGFRGAVIDLGFDARGGACGTQRALDHVHELCRDDAEAKALDKMTNGGEGGIPHDRAAAGGALAVAPSHITPERGYGHADSLRALRQHGGDHARAASEVHKMVDARDHALDPVAHAFDAEGELHVHDPSYAESVFGAPRIQASRALLLRSLTDCLYLRNRWRETMCWSAAARV